MRILLLNGSPRGARANSRIVLDALRSRMGEGHEYRLVETMTGTADSDDLEVDFIVLAFPLYIDSLHSRLLAWLMSYEALRRQAGAAGRVGMIAVANCGFKEGVQTKTALDIVAHFCSRAGIEWRGGLGIGTGEMIGVLKGAPDEMPIKRPVSRALAEIAKRVDLGPELAGNIYATHAFPWLLFKLVGQAGWRQQARANGLGRRDLWARPLVEA